MRDEQDKRPEPRRRFANTSAVDGSAVDMPAAEGAPDDSAAGVERLLAELCQLRLLLDSDLTFAAAALDNDAPEMASDILDDEHEALNALQARILRGLPPVGSRPAEVVPIRPRRRSRLGAAAPAMAAAAVAIAVLGATALPRIHSTHPARAGNVAEATISYDAFSRAAGTIGTNATQMQAAASALHASLAPLIADASHDPESAQRALELLQAEQFLLIQSQPAGAAAILRQAQQLVRKLQAQAPHVVPPATVKAPEQPRATTSSKPKPTTTPSPAPSPSASPSTSPKASPSASPTASSSPGPSGSSAPESRPTIVPGF